jgi:hypothetical protein
MSEISENIRKTFSNMVKIYEETARFFLDADDIMIRNGHHILKGSALESESSRSLNFPRWWLMFSGIRYYVADDDPDIARAIGIFFYDANHDPIDPVVGFGVFKRVEHIDEEPEVNPFGALWDAWYKLGFDQSLNQEFKVEAVRKIDKGKMLGILLEEVADFEALEGMVIAPLLEMQLE